MHRSILCFVINLVTFYEYTYNYTVYRHIIGTEGIKAWFPQVYAFGPSDTTLQRLMLVTRVDKDSSTFNSEPHHKDISSVAAWLYAS
jgi:hypothetical protein